MPTTKHEAFSFGGVDSRSNPANYPHDRSLRCVNWAPTISGQLRLRTGYTAQLTNDTIGGTNSTIHSAVYYEQFAASYLGPQFVIYGKNSQILTYDLNAQLSSSVGAMGSSNPWGHFRSKNRVFLSSGAPPQNTNATAAWESGDCVSWDGLTVRPAGLPNVSVFGGNEAFYAGQAFQNSNPGQTVAWVSLGNMIGPPTTAFCKINLNPRQTSQLLTVQNFGFSIPTTSTIVGMQVVGTAIANQASTYLNMTPTVGGVSINGNVFSSSVMVGPVQPAGPVIFGGQTASFGANLTAAVVNQNTFGVSFYVGTGLFALFVAFYSVQITIFYKNVAGGIVSVTSSTMGSIAPTQLSGYQLFLAIYDPVTQHMGNRATVGNAVTVGSTASAFVITGMFDLSTINTEWVYAVGATLDGGQIPYWLVDSQGNDIVIGNGNTNATVYIGNVNLRQELPINNYPPPKMDKFARVGTRIFGGLSGNPFLNYSNDITDVTDGDYIGNPEESWPADQAQALPTGELPTSIHAYRLEGWFFSRQNLCIWSLFLQQQGANPWRGPYPGGCPSQRGFIETPHGPFWISAEKELCTFMEDGVVAVSDEYELSLLGKIADATLNTVELGYLLDQTQLVDQIVIRGLDAQGNPVVVVHDFYLREERSPHGQGYVIQYGGLAVQTFVGAGFTPRQNVYDVNGKQRLWAGAVQGFFAQLEDGLSDNGATYSADYIGLISLGPNRPALLELEYQGDPNIQWSYLPDYSGSLGDFLPVQQETIPEAAETTTRFGVKFGQEECRWAYVRAQLTSHPADGNFTLTDPPFIPIPSYGVINLTVVKTGADRPEGR